MERLGRSSCLNLSSLPDREAIVASRHRGMRLWRDRLFAVMHRNAASANLFPRILGSRFVKLGAQVEI